MGMVLRIDLTGKKYGKWTVIKRLPRQRGSLGQVKWLCRCECGTEIQKGTHYLRNDWNSLDCGCSRTLVGKKFSSLKVIERLVKDHRYEGNYLCVCDCGKRTICRGKTLISGRLKSCGCGRKKSVTQNGRSLSRRAYMTNAKKRGLVFEIDKELFASMIESPCFYCGKIETNFTHAYKKTCDSERYLHNGIDRIDNDKGYTIENSVPCCKLCNRMKWCLTFREWIDHMKIVLNQQKLTAQAV